jgi:competence protein ComEA
MPQVPRSRIAAYATGALIVLVVGVWSLRGAGGATTAASAGGHPGGAAHAAGPASGRSTGSSQTSSGLSVEGPPAPAPVVHVAGAVRHTGVYRLPDGSRVEDAVHRAGGPTRKANLDGINLAAKVADGQQVIVPERVTRASTSDAGGGGGGGATDGPDGTSVPAAPVGLNAATLEQLQTLDGVGPATAEKIVAWRTEHGGFRSVDDLGQVPGIGPKRLAALREHVQP